MARKPTGKPNGRPPKEIDEQMFRKLCQIFCTEEEIANIFECTTNTLNAWCERTFGEGFCETYKKLSSEGKASLRRMQMKQAEKSPAMAIWLGKQYLGQTDNPTNENTDKVIINITGRDNEPT